MATTFAKVEMLRRWSTDLQGAASDVTEVVAALEISDVAQRNAAQNRAFQESLGEKTRELARKRRLQRS